MKTLSQWINDRTGRTPNARDVCIAPKGAVSEAMGTNRDLNLIWMGHRPKVIAADYPGLWDSPVMVIGSEKPDGDNHYLGYETVRVMYGDHLIYASDNQCSFRVVICQDGDWQTFRRLIRETAGDIPDKRQLPIDDMWSVVDCWLDAELKDVLTTDMWDRLDAIGIETTDAITYPDARLVGIVPDCMAASLLRMRDYLRVTGSPMDMGCEYNADAERMEYDDEED